MRSVMYLSSGRPPNGEEQVPLVEVELTHAARQTKERTLAAPSLLGYSLREGISSFTAARE
jgi:hypothetical protein